MKSHDFFMKAALAEARIAASQGEVPVGAVVTFGGEIVGRGHNKVEQENDVSAHAEIVASKAAGIHLGDWRLTKASLYVTLEPCPMCMSAMVLARVEKIYFAAHDPRLGAGGSICNLADHSDLPHKIQLFSGLMEKESSALLEEFFKGLRSKN